jgi:repressor LexA
MEVSELLQAIRTARGWTQEELADALDVGQSTVSRLEKGGGVPYGGTMELIRKLARESGIVERDPVLSNQAPLMGRVGAGAVIDVEFEQPPPEGYHTIELPFTFPEAVIAFEVEGDSMLPAYEPGEVIVCLRDQVRATEHYLGKRVVVRLSTGQRFVKRLVRGSRKGFFNLESWNALTIEDVRIEWVGEIVASVNPAMVRQVERRHQQAKRAAAKAKAGRRASA